MALVNWWKFDETSGTSASDNGSQNKPFTLYNTDNNAWTPGLISGAISLDGVDDYGRTLHYYIGTYFTFSVWYKTSTTSSLALLIEKGSVWNNGGNPMVGIYMASGKAQFYNYFTTLSDTINTNDNRWHNAVLTSNNLTFSLYVDNRYIGSTNQSGTLYDNQGFSIGKENAGLNYYLYNGLLDQIRIYDTVLTTQEITDLYNEGKQYILCWNYKARYKNSDRFYTTNGSGPYPKQLKVPSSVDISSGMMIDEGRLISPDQYRII